MDGHKILTLDERKLLIEMLKQVLNEQKPVFEGYQKYIEKREKLDCKKTKIDIVNKIKKSND